ncbi:hypothetical protein C7460_13626 [Marinoscillum furvescens DSM 4134]|uniref:Uncharacterized protein n=2 Tax=Marinoscillum furvescens TaxID=1026 RepID=A0A3D9KVV2_MARFU|nr:hypothetical protein C7460_13626 [Marinoscillum furvescens DSM 4134]
MIIDMDHLLASPIFSANRCSIGFHPLHTSYAALVYAAGLLLPKWIRIVAIGLLLHLLTDLIDCLWMYQSCRECIANQQVAQLLDWFSW